MGLDKWEGGVRLPLGAETGDISRVERFRWIVLEAAAGEVIYRPLLCKKPEIYGGLMELWASEPCTRLAGCRRQP